MNPETPLGAMMRQHAYDGRLDWIGLRSERRRDVVAVDQAEVLESGLIGDHGRAGKRAVTLIQAEHFPVIAALVRDANVTPAVLRRNLVISGINLAGLRKGLVRVGRMILQIEGPCPPCSRMEELLGHGGYNAVRGHGGWYASVSVPGPIKIGDSVVAG